MNKRYWMTVILMLAGLAVLTNLTMLRAQVSSHSSGQKVSPEKLAALRDRVVTLATEVEVLQARYESQRAVFRDLSEKVVKVDFMKENNFIGPAGLLSLYLKVIDAESSAELQVSTNAALTASFESGKDLKSIEDESKKATAQDVAKLDKSLHEGLDRMQIRFAKLAGDWKRKSLEFQEAQSDYHLAR